MKTVQLGNTDIQLSAVIMGTWQAGKKMWSGISDAEIQKALEAAADAGVTAFDTAPVYGDGHAEQALGKALGYMRQKLIFLTKVFPHHLKREKLIGECEKSLKTLGTDYIDLYQIHWPSGSFGSKTVPIQESMEALMQLRKDGKIRAIGVSNFSAKQLAEAAAFGPVVSLQPPYSLFWRQAESDGIAWCRENDATTLAYSPMAQGLLTGKFKAGHQFAPEDHRSKNRLFQPEHFERAAAALEELRPIAEARDITLGQLALAWVIAQPKSCAIAGARNADQAVQNAAAGSVELSADELAEIDRIGRTVTDYLDNDPMCWNF